MKIIVQFNEANFDIIRKYCETHDLKNFKKILGSKSFSQTHSENKYENLEPWIQWYSFYTGKTLEEHQVFHLGDCLKNNHKNFLQEEAVAGKKMGVFGSMNMPYSDVYKIFIPDAWTESECDQSLNSKLIKTTLSNIVNSNSRLRISLSDILGLIILIGIPSRFEDIKIFFRTIFSFINRSRAELASYFDYYFMRYAIKRSKREKLEISQIFLNGFAHIQHHYLYSSELVTGKNPSWYVSSEKDLILESLKIYDKTFGLLFTLMNNNDEFFILTGLTQKPYKKPEIYWRFRDHKKVLNNFFNFDFKVFPRMTRDFEVFTTREMDIESVMDFLNKARIEFNNNETKAFDFVNQTSPKSIFATFSYAGDSKKIILKYKNIRCDLNNNLDFVALKNAGHHEKGWLISNRSIENQDIYIWDAYKYISEIRLD